MSLWNIFNWSFIEFVTLLLLVDIMDDWFNLFIKVKIYNYYSAITVIVNIWKMYKNNIMYSF